MVEVRQLHAGDEDVLALLAADAVALGLSDDGRPLRALDAERARAYLRDPSVLHWVAFVDDTVVGTTVAIQVHLPISPGCELLVHEIGVRDAYRRRGVGTALLRAIEDWMRTHDVETVWLLADGEGAKAFYSAFGYRLQPDQPFYMVRTIGGR